MQTASSAFISVMFCLSILLEGKPEKEWQLDQDLFKK
jgi:hypothetical protein